MINFIFMIRRKIDDEITNNSINIYSLKVIGKYALHTCRFEIPKRLPIEKEKKNIAE